MREKKKVQKVIGRGKTSRERIGSDKSAARKGSILQRTNSMTTEELSGGSGGDRKGADYGKKRNESVDARATSENEKKTMNKLGELEGKVTRSAEKEGGGGKKSPGSNSAGRS